MYMVHHQQDKHCSPPFLIPKTIRNCEKGKNYLNSGNEVRWLEMAFWEALTVTLSFLLCYMHIYVTL